VLVSKYSAQSKGSFRAASHLFEHTAFSGGVQVCFGSAAEPPARSESALGYRWRKADSLLSADCVEKLAIALGLSLSL
jgi:hypothetical protein